MIKFQQKQVGCWKNHPCLIEVAMLRNYLCKIYLTKCITFSNSNCAFLLEGDYHSFEKENKNSIISHGFINHRIPKALPKNQMEDSVFNREACFFRLKIMKQVLIQRCQTAHRAEKEINVSLELRKDDLIPSEF